MATQNRDPRSHRPAVLIAVRRLTLVLVLVASQGFIIAPSTANTYVRWQRHPSSSPTQWPRYSMGPYVHDLRRDRLAIQLPGGLWSVALRETTEFQHVDGLDLESDAHSHWAVYDSSMDRMVIAGGGRTVVNSMAAHGVVGVWSRTLGSAANWTELDAGPRPLSRYAPSHGFDSNSRTMVVTSGESHVFSGYCTGHDPRYDYADIYHDTWRLSLDDPPRWSLVCGGLGNADGAMVRDTRRGRYLYFGGQHRVGSCESEYTDCVNDVWALGDGDSFWTLLPISGDRPAPRARSAAIYDPVADRMLIFGGQTCGYFGDVWELSLPSNQWRPLEFASAESPPRLYDTDAIVRDQAGRIWLFFREGELWSMTEETATSTLASLVTSEVVGGRPRLAWRVSSDAECRIERAQSDESWQLVSRVTPDGQGYVRFAETHVLANGRWGYRIVVSDPQERFTSEPVWLRVVAPNDVSLRVTGSQPVVDVLSLSCEVPDEREAILDLIDAGGRRIVRRKLVTGDGVVRIDLSTSALSPGLYFVRFYHPAGVASLKVIVAR